MSCWPNLPSALGPPYFHLHVIVDDVGIWSCSQILVILSLKVSRCKWLTPLDLPADICSSICRVMICVCSLVWGWPPFFVLFSEHLTAGSPTFSRASSFHMWETSGFGLYSDVGNYVWSRDTAVFCLKYTNLVQLYNMMKGLPEGQMRGWGHAQWWPLF